MTVLLVSLVVVTPVAALVCYVDDEGTKNFVSSKEEVPARFRDKVGCPSFGATTPPATSQPTPAAPGATVDGPIPLNTLNPDYRDYMERVKQRIHAKWGYPFEAQSRGLQGRVEIEFHIARNGELKYVQVKQSSGEEILDTVAIQAVKLAQPYPPLPEAMKREVLPILGSFVYSLRTKRK